MQPYDSREVLYILPLNFFVIQTIIFQCPDGRSAPSGWVLGLATKID